MTPPAWSRPRTAIVTDRERGDYAVREAVERLGRPTILVNSAGFDGLEPFLDITARALERILAVNLTGTFNCCHETDYLTGQVIGVNGGMMT